MLPGLSDSLDSDSNTTLPVIGQESRFKELFQIVDIVKLNLVKPSEVCSVVENSMWSALCPVQYSGCV